MSDVIHELIAEFRADRAAAHRKIDACVGALHHLMQRIDPMSKAHDDLLAAAKDADAQADALIAAKSSGDGKLTDILAVVSGTRDKLAAAAKADKDEEDAKGTNDAAANATTAAASATVLDPVTGLPVAS